MKILLPIDGSSHSIEAVKYLIEHVDWYSQPPTVDLVCVQQPLPTLLPQMAFTVDQLERYYHEAGDASLTTAKNMLERAGLTYSAHILVGPTAESIVEQSKKSGCDLILLATRGMGAAGNLLLGSTATKVIYFSTTIPVLVVNSGISF